MKIQVLKKFRDLKENVERKVGDVFEVDEKRFEEIKAGLTEFGEGNWVEEVKEVAKEELKEEAPKVEKRTTVKK